MAEFLRLLFSLSLSGGILTLFLALLNRLLQRKMPRRFLYYLWLLALLCFLLPVGADWSLTHRLLDGSTTDNTPSTVVDVAPVIPLEPTAGETIFPISPSESEAAEPPIPQPASFSPAVLLFGVWALGVFGCITLKLYSYFHLKAELWQRQKPVTAWEMERFRSLTQEDSTRPVLRRSAAAQSPMLTGLLCPEVWIPEEPINPAAFSLALRHELNHWRRHDLWLKWAAALTACLHWFNPASWYLVQAIDRDCELSCDEHVVEGLPLSERITYGELLLQCASGSSHSGALSASLRNQKLLMKERMHVIMNKNLDSKRARALLTVAVAAAALLSISLGACAVWSSPAPEVPGIVPQSQAEEKEHSDAPQVIVPQSGLSEAVVPTDPAPESVPISESNESAKVPIVPDSKSESVPAVFTDGQESVSELPAKESNSEVQSDSLSGAVNETPGISIPEGLPDGTEFVVSGWEEGEPLMARLMEEYGLVESDIEGCWFNNGTDVVLRLTVNRRDARIANAEKEGILVNGDWPKNSKGETYGSYMDNYRELVGYDPDLIAVRGENGRSGYVYFKPFQEGTYDMLDVYDLNGNVIDIFTPCGPGKADQATRDHLNKLTGGDEEEVERIIEANHANDSE